MDAHAHVEEVKTADLLEAADQLGTLIDANIGLSQRLDRLEKEKAELVKALERSQRFLEALFREGPSLLLPSLMVKTLQETEQTVRGALAKHGGA